MILLLAALFKRLSHRGFYMAKCNDCWCEHYEKNRGNCDNCVKNANEKDKPDLQVLLKNRASEQIHLLNTTRIKGQIR